MGQHLAQAQAHLSASSEVMADLISRFVPPPIDTKPPELYFDVLVSSIIGQQLSVKAADTIEARFRTLAGELNPQRILELDPAEMREQGLSYSKISYLHALADAFHQGSLEPHALETMPEADITASLTAVKGIGLWTAEMFMIFGMGRPDVWSPGDLGLRKALWALFGEDADLTETSNDWAPYRSYASLYLWKFWDERPKTPKAAAQGTPAN